MRLQKCKNSQKISLFLPTAENPEQALNWTLANHAFRVALMINCLKMLCLKLFTSPVNRDVNNF
jgi:hypothetical protein